MSNPMGSIFNIQRHSTEDGPGIRTTVFLKGCCMRCPWCQNPESINKHAQLVWHDGQCIGDGKCIQSCPQKALKLTADGILIDRSLCDACGICAEACLTGAMEILGRKYSASEVASIVLEDKVFYDKSQGGMTLSGGEPSLQPAFCETLMKTVKVVGVHVALDTCCGADWKVLAPLVELADLILLDIKTMDETDHRKYTGITLQHVLKNAKRIAGQQKPIWVRTPIIPGYTDKIDNIKKIADFIQSSLPTVTRYDILAFNNYCASKYTNLGLTWKLIDAPLIPESDMAALVQAAQDSGLPFARWSGLTRVESS